MRDGANAGARIDDTVAVDGTGDNDAARVAVVTDRLRLAIAMEAASCIAPGDIGSSHVSSTALAHSRPLFYHESWQNDICSFRAMTVALTVSFKLISF